MSDDQRAAIDGIGEELAQRRSAMLWAVDKLDKLERLLEYDLSTLRAVRHALGKDNPRLKGA